MSTADPRPRRFRFDRRLRILRQADFARLLKTGKRLSDERLTVWALPNGLEHSRLGLVVGRKHGNAVQRNRIKRRLRAAFRLAQYDLPSGLDFACSARPGPLSSMAEYRASLLKLAARLANRLRDGV